VPSDIFPSDEKYEGPERGKPSMTLLWRCGERRTRFIFQLRRTVQGVGKRGKSSEKETVTFSKKRVTRWRRIDKREKKKSKNHREVWGISLFKKSRSPGEMTYKRKLVGSQNLRKTENKRNRDPQVSEGDVHPKGASISRRMDRLEKKKKNSEGKKKKNLKGRAVSKSQIT